MSYNDIEYFIEPLIFRVEDTLFRIPPEYLSQESPVFRDMLNLPQPSTGDEGSVIEGSTDTAPIMLPDTITANSFRALLEVLYPRDPLHDVILTMDEWLSVLELSKMWDMTRVREAAINNLVPDLEDDPARKWSLAKRYEIRDWIQPALEKLIRRSESLGTNDLREMDQDTFLNIANIRESCYPVYYDTQYGYYDENAGIVRWEVKQERGAIILDLSSSNFTCPTPPLIQDVDENPSLEESEATRRNGAFFFEKVVFKVEDELYKVPNQPFARHSPVFRRRFENRGTRKYNCQDPLIIDASVKKTDFEALLSLLFPEPIGNLELSSDDWASVLRLAARWQMPRIKQLAVEKLQNLDFGTVSTKLQMAQELGVQDWFSSGMTTLVTRRETLGAAEFQVLSQDNVIQILNLRERAHYRHRYHYGEARILRDSRGEVPATLDLSSQLASLV